MAGVLDLMGYVQKQGEAGRARGQETALGRLAGQAYGAAPDQRTGILSQMAQIDRGAAQQQSQQFKTGDSDRVAQLSQKAKLFVGMAKAGNQQAVAGMYPQIAKEARELFGTEVPDTYDPSFLAGIEQFANIGNGAGDDLKSLRVGDDGFYYAIQGGQLVNTGVKAAPQNQIIDTGDGFYGVNKGNLQAAPVQVGGAPQQSPQAPPAGMYQTPQGVVRLGDDLSPEQREAAMADVAAGGGASQVELPQRNAAPQQFGGSQLRSAPKPASVPSGYRDNGAGGLSPIPGGPAQIAIDARADAAAARKVAEDIKTSAKRQEAEARQNASTEAATALITSIDDLTNHPGFAELGTAWGDTKIGTPLIRNAAKDADAKLKNVAGQVALATLSRLKTLSATGATGFGSLTKPELDLVQNSIATLQSENISNAELKKSLKVIRDAMEKTTKWQPSADTSGGASIDALLDKWK